LSLIGNIVWIIFGGLFAALGYILGGVSLCLTIIGIPFGWKAIQLGIAAFAPFGKEVVQTRGGSNFLALLFNILWLIVFGWGIALVHIVFGIILTVTIVGIPFGKQHFKLVMLALFPFSYRLE
jgi:uncharacterized membrane protein YccF (DUF307 family)